MENTPIFIDLPNFYGNLLKTNLAEPKMIREYFMYWLDFDRLAKLLTWSNQIIWIFYSGNKLGPSEARIEKEYLIKYINRLNKLKGVTAYDVNIPGEQREHFTLKCNCGEENVAVYLSEKGVDSSLIVHLFDTSESWNTAYLISNDADFAPAVSSLRRRGKMIIGAGFTNASNALVRECYDYINIPDLFINDDMFGFFLFKEKGIVNQFLTKITEKQSIKYGDRIILSVSWYLNKDKEEYVIKFSHKGEYNSNFIFNEINTTLQSCKMQKIKNHYGSDLLITLPRFIWEGIERRMKLFADSTGIKQTESSFVTSYTYTGGDEKFIPSCY